MGLKELKIGSKGLIKASLLGTLAGVVGCSNNSGSSESGLELKNDALSRYCKTLGQVESVDSIELKGDRKASADGTASYQLNEELGCSSQYVVSWKASEGAKVQSSGPFLEAQFEKAGTYVVTAEVTSLSNPEPQLFSVTTTVVEDQIAYVGPEVVMVGVGGLFDLAIPDQMSVQSAQWNFGDGTSVVPHQEGGVRHTFSRAGQYLLVAEVVQTGGASFRVEKTLQVLPLQDGFECVNDLALNVPAEVQVNQPKNMSIFIPTCLYSVVTGVRWDYGDGTQPGAGQSVQHTYLSPGLVNLSVMIFRGADQVTPWLILNRQIQVLDAPAVTPTPSPSPTPSPTPNPANECLLVGQQRVREGELYSESQSCGVQGHRDLTYRDVLKQECQLQGDVLKWTTLSTEKTLVSEGACLGQACAIPGTNEMISDGQSRVYYQESLPEGSCEEQKQTRTCTNGVLSGTALNATCLSGCFGFGKHGTEKSAVVIGEELVVKQCAFGETGIFDIYSRVADQSCVNGVIGSANERQGSIQTAGICPTYSWTATEQWTTCTADCGGEQSQIYDCRNDKNEVVEQSRCQGDKPHQTRLCDANPDAVKRTEVTESEEEAPSSALCPSNQIGVIVNSRTVTTTSQFACVDHSTQLVSESKEASPWVENRYCEDLVPYRCSQDSLSNKDAKGRYLWMMKCQNQIPILKEFIDKFDDVELKKGNTRYSIDGSGRNLYPTFMVRKSNNCKLVKNRNGKVQEQCEKDKVWIAPKIESAECKVPEGTYVAAVCLSSCATPEETIMAQAKGKGRIEPVPFIQALTQNMKFVGTLHDEAHARRGELQKTRVDQWVTEMMDTEHVILVFKMKSGGVLKVTPNHPLLDSQGRMRLAEEFKEGEFLVKLGAEQDLILEIQKTPYFGKVYNVFVKSADLLKNVVVTQGYLNGTAYFQNEGTKDLNRVIFRSRLTKGVFNHE